MKPRRTTSKRPAPSPAPAAPLPATSGVGPAQPSAVPPILLHQMIVSRRRQRRLDIELVQGDITGFNSRAYVLGVFQGVAPSGAAAAVDGGMNGAIRDIVQRRMFEARAGEVFMMPAGRRGLRADTVVLAGLGPFDRFDGQVQELVSENVVRTLVAASIDEFACVLLGDSVMGCRAATLRNMLKGMIAGLLDADSRFSFRRVSICERDPASAGELREALVRVAASDLFQDVEVSFSEITLPPAPAALPVRSGTLAAAGPSAYLLIRQVQAAGGADDGRLTFEQHLMGPTSRAALSVASVAIEPEALTKQLAGIEAPSFAPHAFGSAVAELLLSGELRAELLGMRDCPLVILHDATASQVPWETLRIADWSPALDCGLSRRYLASNLSTAKWSVLNQQGQILNVLLVVNPTSDLDGAEAEGRLIREVLGGRGGIRLTTVERGEATRARLLTEMASGRYDVLHYAGHAFFDAEDRARSGLVCAGRQILSGADAAGLRCLPALMFFNACESARVRRWQDSEQELPACRHAEQSHGLAEAFIRGGVANLVGTYWPVGDQPASTFAEVFYGAIVAGRPLGQAMIEARGRISDSTDWADYILYGDAEFRVKCLPDG